jgi:hypothetical protein
MTRIEEIKYRLTLLNNRDTLHTDRAAMAEYDALRRELAEWTPVSVAPVRDEIASARAWVVHCRAVIRHYVTRIRNGGSRMNLSWEMGPYWRDYRAAVSSLSRLKAARATITFTADDIATEAGRQNVMTAIMGRAAENAGGAA